jgi:hypothetical protein
MPTKAAQLLVAIESFAVETGRREDDTPVMRIVLVGNRVRADDDIVPGREELFAPVGNNTEV